ncbi:MAG: lysophospholipid acyltransferase family protein [Verrucomicrobia bacterium]|nr:lysophospholipid acyltransferase family protein [Verrucomicrobiota bacterium]
MRLKRLRYWIEWLGVVWLAKLVPLLPYTWLKRLAKVLGSGVYFLDRSSRQVALANLEAAFQSGIDDQSKARIARRSLEVFARAFLELFWTSSLIKKPLERYISFENPEMFSQVLAETKPVIGITPHFANFEWGSALFALNGYPGTILTQRFKNNLLTEIFMRLRGSAGHAVVTQERSMLRLLKSLGRGTPVGILTDLTLKLGDPAVIIESFGLKMRVTMIHAVLHQRTGCPILPFITLPRHDGGYQVRILPLLRFPESASTQKIVQKCWDQFEPIIRSNPEYWLWVYKHWRYKPELDEHRYPFYANRSHRFDGELRAAADFPTKPVNGEYE